MDKSLNVRVPAALRERIDEIHEERGFTSRSEFVRNVLRDAVEAEQSLTDAATDGITYQNTTSEISLEEAKQRFGIEQVQAEAERSFEGSKARVTMGEFEEYGTVTTVVESDIGFLTADDSDTDILVVGCGGGGVRITSQIHRRGNDSHRTAILDTDLSRLNDGEANLRALVGKQRYDGNGSDGDVEGVQQVIRESDDFLDQILQNPDLVFVISGLGGGTGTGLAPRVAELAREKGAVTVSLATLPFQRSDPVVARAREGLTRLDEVSDTIAVLDGHRVSADPALSLSEALERMNDNIAHLVSQISTDIGQFYFSTESDSLLSVLRDGGRSVLLNSEIDTARGESYDELSDRLLQYTNVDARSVSPEQAVLTFTAGSGIADPKERIDDIVSSFNRRARNTAWSSQQIQKSTGIHDYSIRVAGFLTGLDVALDEFFGREQSQTRDTQEQDEADIEILPGTGGRNQSVA